MEVIIYECLTHRRYEGLSNSYCTTNKKDAYLWLRENPDEDVQLKVWKNKKLIENVWFTCEWKDNKTILIRR